MFSFINMFRKQSDLYLKTTYDFDIRVPPSQLIKQLNRHPTKKKKETSSKSLNKQASQKTNEQLKSFLKKISKPTKNGAKIMRILTILHLLIIYSDQFYNIIDSVLPLSHLCTDIWLINTVIKPYQKFVKKCCSSREFYCKNKELNLYSQQNSFQRLFYLINMLNQLFKCVKKMSLLGRYYKQDNGVNTSLFVNTVALQAQKLYINFKNVLSDMLFYSQKYLKTPADQQIMKGILSQSLLYINQEMKKLFLDKYFYPYGKGIGVKLFRVQQQSQDCAKKINSILNNHQNTNRERNRLQLQEKIFPKGVFSAKMFEKSLMETFLNHKSNNAHNFEEEIANEDIEEGFDIEQAKKYTQMAEQQDIEKGVTYNLKLWEIHQNHEKQIKNKKCQNGLLSRNSNKLKQLKSTDTCEKKPIDINQF